MFVHFAYWKRAQMCYHVDNKNETPPDMVSPEGGGRKTSNQRSRRDRESTLKIEYRLQSKQTNDYRLARIPRRREKPGDKAFRPADSMKCKGHEKKRKQAADSKPLFIERDHRKTSAAAGVQIPGFCDPGHVARKNQEKR